MNCNKKDNRSMGWKYIVWDSKHRYLDSMATQNKTFREVHFLETKKESKMADKTASVTFAFCPQSIQD